MYRKIQLTLTDTEKMKLPILIKDEKWNKIFGDRDNEKIRKLKIELQKLLDEDEFAQNQIRDLKKEKRKTMAEILDISDEVNNAGKRGSLRKLDKNRRHMEKLNSEIEEISFRLETLPKEIAIVNYVLLEATVEEGYLELSTLDEENREINREMLEIRDRLQELYDNRNENDEKIADVYKLMHGALGAKLIEKVDDRLEKEDEDDGD